MADFTPINLTGNTELDADARRLLNALFWTVNSELSDMGTFFISDLVWDVNYAFRNLPDVGDFTFWAVREGGTEMGSFHTVNDVLQTRLFHAVYRIRRGMYNRFTLERLDMDAFRDGIEQLAESDTA